MDAFGYTCCYQPLFANHIFKRIKNNIGFIKKKLNSGYFKRQYLNIKLIQVLKNCILNTAIQYLYSQNQQRKKS